MTENKTDNRTQFYSHISRLYNSGTNIVIAIIFGWLAYIGIFINLTENPAFVTSLPIIKISLIFPGVIIILLATYFFYRFLMFSRWIIKIENDLELRPYTKTLPRLPLFSEINERPQDDPTKWTFAEKVSIICYFLLFAGPTVILVWRNSTMFEIDQGLAIIISAIIAIVGYVLQARSSQNREIESKKHQRKIEQYENMIKALSGFYKTGTTDAKNQFIEEYYKSWLYASNETLIKINEFLTLASKPQEGTIEEDQDKRKEVIKAVLIYLRKDLGLNPEEISVDFNPWISKTP